MTRRELREHIFNELFTSDFYLTSDEDLMALYLAGLRKARGEDENQS